MRGCIEFIVNFLGLGGLAQMVERALSMRELAG